MPRLARSIAPMALALLGALAARAAPAEAEPFWRQGVVAPRPESNFDVAMRAADEYAEQAASHSMRSPRHAHRLARQAIEAYEHAIAADAARPEPYYRAAELLYAHFIRDDDDPDPEMCQRAIGYWRRFEELEPLDSRLVDVLIRRSLTHTKIASAEHLEHALADYRSLLAMLDARSVDAEAMATWLSNKAEILMMLGRLGEAIEEYERSLEFQDRALYAYGLAVALDRDGQGEKAREVMRVYAASDELRDLTRPGVFFVPEGEVHYYLGLGHAALGNEERALRHFERFLTSGAHPQFGDRAREHVTSLEARPTEARR